MHYQIFIPRATGQNPKLLADVGLADHAESADFLHCDKGPDGSPGVIVAWQRPGATGIGYQPARQEWFPAVPSGELPAKRYWVGFWTHSLPDSADLAKPRLTPGERMQLGNGDEWLIPAAKNLPMSLILDDYGNWQPEVPEHFRGFYAEYCYWLELVAKSPDPLKLEIDLLPVAAYLLQALRLNYRLTAEVASRLRLFSTDNAARGLLITLGGLRP